MRHIRSEHITLDVVRAFDTEVYERWYHSDTGAILWYRVLEVGDIEVKNPFIKKVLEDQFQDMIRDEKNIAEPK